MPACQSCDGTTDTQRGLPNGRDYWLCRECHDKWWDFWERWRAVAPRVADRVRVRASQRRIARAHGIAPDGSRIETEGGGA